MLSLCHQGKPMFRHFGNAASFYFILAIGGILRITPRFALSPVSGLLGSLMFLLGIRRRMVLQNLGRCFPEWSLWRRLFTAWRCCMWVVFLFLDFHHASLHRFRLSGKDGALILKGAEHVKAIGERGRGCILTSVHMGSWELHAATMALHGFPVSVIVSELRNPLLDGYIARMRRKWGNDPVPKGAGIRRLFSVLRQNRILGLLFDQDARRNGIFCEFFGQPAATFDGPATFALKTGAGLVFGKCHYRGGTLIAEYESVEIVSTGDRGADVRRITQRLNDLAEAAIREHPHQYFWFHNRFKTKPPETSA